MWVLLFVVMTVGTDRDVSTDMTSAEFTTKERCEAAGEAFTKPLSSETSYPTFVCVQK